MPPPSPASPPDATRLSSPVVEARQLHKSYGPTKALNAVDFALHAGELVALLGPNGAGKSTLVQVLSGLFVADHGTLRLLGVDMRRQPHRALAGLGVVFQQPSLDLDLSVLSNLLFHTDLHGLPRALAHQRIAQGLAQYGLAAQADHPVRTLSGGNRRKVELLRALLHQPRFVLMDEATVGLDPQSRRDLMHSVRAWVRQQQAAVLWATHLVDEAAQADRLLLLHRGRLRFDGPPAGLLQRHQTDSLEQAFLRECGAPSTAAGPP